MVAGMEGLGFLIEFGEEDAAGGEEGFGGRPRRGGPQRAPQAQGCKNLALLRRALLSLIPSDQFDSLNAAFDYYGGHRTAALHLLTRTPPQCP